jgi:hypothetical protein
MTPDFGAAGVTVDAGVGEAVVALETGAGLDEEDV